MSSFISKVDTNLEAYKLVYDPTRLLYLLFTKYGDIEEDYNNLILNQLLFNKLSHLNSIFKENCYTNNYNEFLKRKYKKKESIDRIPKLYDYYKNYYLYFCKPFFLNFFSANLLHNYYNNKAEIFYKNNYSTSIEKTEEENNKGSNSNSLSSLDNDTQNKTIFTKRNKYFIDNDIDSNKCSITLTFDSIDKYNEGLESKRSKNNSFEKMINYFINEYKVKQKKKNDKKLIQNEYEKLNNNEDFKKNSINNKINDLKIKEKNNETKNDNNFINSNNKIKEKNYNIKGDDNNNFYDFIQNNTNNRLNSKLSRNSSELEELKKFNNNLYKQQQNNYNIYDFLNNQILKKNQNIIKFNNHIDNNEKNIINKKIINEKIKSSSRNNNRKQNIFKLNNKLNTKNTFNFINIESRNSPKKEQELLKFKDFITLKSTKNNLQMDRIKIFKITNNQNNNKIIGQSKFKTLSMNKRATESIKDMNNKNNFELKKDSSKLNTIFQSDKKNKSNKKLNILNKFSPIIINNRHSTNVNLKNKLTNFNSESSSPKHNVILRNELFSKKKSETNIKLTLFESINGERNSLNQKNMLKLLHKNNLSYSNNENEQNNIFNNMKSFNSDQGRGKRNSNIIIKNFLFKNYTMGKVLMGNNSNNKKILYGINNLKNFLQISRNKNKKNMNTFLEQSIPHSLSHSKSTSKDIGKKNLLRTSSFRTFGFDDKKICINNLKMKNNNKYNSDIIEDIIKNSKINELNIGKSDIKYFGKNKNIYKSFGLNSQKRIFSPINVKQSFNFNKKVFKSKKNY